MAKRAGFILCLVVCALGVGASLARADAAAAAMIAAGVLIGSVDVSGMTADQATAAVQQAYFAPLAVHVGHHGFSVSPHHFHTSLDVSTPRCRRRSRLRPTRPSRSRRRSTRSASSSG